MGSTTLRTESLGSFDSNCSPQHLEFDPCALASFVKRALLAKRATSARLTLTVTS
jgi:hypothetical protein